MDQQRANTQVFDQLSVGDLVSLAARLVIEAGARDLREVLDHLPHLAAALDGGIARQTQPEQEPLAPFTHGSDPDRERCLIGGQQGCKLQLLAVEFAAQGGVCAYQELVAAGGVRVLGGSALIQQRFEQRRWILAETAGDPAGERTMALGGTHGDAGLGESGLERVEFHGRQLGGFAATPRRAIVAPRRWPSRVDRAHPPSSTLTAMDETHSRHVFDEELRRLELRIGELAALCERLREENRGLRQSQDSLSSERANLLARHDQVRARVEAMIDRLKGLEQTA